MTPLIKAVIDQKIDIVELLLSKLNINVNIFYIIYYCFMKE